MSDNIVIKPGARKEEDRHDQHKPLNREEKLETGLEDSMDASDPPATTTPGDSGDPVPSSGYSEDDGAGTA